MEMKILPDQAPYLEMGGKPWFSETAVRMKRWRGIKVGSADAHRMLDNRHKSQHGGGLTGLCPLRGVMRLLQGWRGGWVLRWGLLIARWPDCSCRCRMPCSEWLRLCPPAAACRRRSGMPSSSFRQTFWTSPLWVGFHREYMNDGLSPCHIKWHPLTTLHTHARTHTCTHTHTLLSEKLKRQQMRKQGSFPSWGFYFVCNTSLITGHIITSFITGPHITSLIIGHM